jgi:hypothetical protein
MSLRPFTAPWAEADVAPWVPPATTGLALLLGTCATLLLAHGRAAQLRFNVRAPESTQRCYPAARADVQRLPHRPQAFAGLSAAAAAAVCAVAMAHAGRVSAMQALPSSALALVTPRTVRNAMPPHSHAGHLRKMRVAVAERARVRYFRRSCRVWRCAQSRSLRSARLRCCS